MTAVDPWGGSTGLSSSLGSAPADPWSLPAQSAQPQQHSGGGFWGSITNPLGLRTSLTQITSGLAHMVGGTITDVGQAIGSAASGQGSEALGDLGSAAQHVGDIGVGAFTAGEALTKDLTRIADPTGHLGNALGKDIYAPFNKWLSTASDITPTSQAALRGPDGKGYNPDDIVQAAFHEGVGASAIGTIGQIATFAGPVAGVAAGLGGAAADAATAAEAGGAVADAASYAAKADQFTKVAETVQKAATPYRSVAEQIATRTGNATMQSVLENTSHPFSYIGTKASDLIGAMRSAAFPAELPPAAVHTATDAGIHAEADLPVPVLAATHEQMSPAPAAADTIATSAAAHDDIQAQLDALSKEIEAQQVAPTTAKTGEPMVTLYRGEKPGGTTNAGEAGDVGSWYTDNRDAAKMWAGDNGVIKETQVPQSVYDETKVGNVQYNDAGDLASQHQLPPEYRAAEAKATESNNGKPVEPQLEPRKYQPGKGTPATPEEKAAMDAELRAQTAEARSNVTPPLYVYDQLGRRINTPTPMWANRIAENLPDSINRLIGRLGSTLITGVRYRDLQRNLMQAMETSQQVARSSDAMTAAVEAAQQLLSDSAGRDVAGARVGEEITSRLNGETMVDQFVKVHGGITPEQVDALHTAAHKGHLGISDNLLASLTPEKRAALLDAVNRATDAFKVEQAKAMETLLASRYGAKGLESALLNPDEATMTPEQLRLYRRSERDLRFAAKAREKIVSEREKREAQAAKAEADGSRAHSFVDTLRQRMGFNLQTAEDLFKGVPKGMENEAAATIQLGMQTLASEGGALLDVGTGKTMHPTAGINISFAPQFDVPLDQWAAHGESVLHDAIFNPKSTDGQVYDPQALWGGQDAKLGIRLVQQPDGMHVVGSISEHTIDGNPIQPWQAHILGGARGVADGFDFGSGDTQKFTDVPQEQTLMQHYIGDVLDPKSGLSRWAQQRADAVANLNITSDQLNAETTKTLWLDHLLAQRNDQWKRGDIFNSELAYAKGEPTLPYLAQTIMEDLSVPEHTDKAMLAADVTGVNNMLAWYYKSHDFIEAAYRGKVMPITGRDAAETFYDVLALSSVMASPTQNLGRALAGFANLDDFIKTRQSALTETQAIMDEALAGRTPADVVYVRGLGTDNERIVQRGQGGTPVAARWMNSPQLKDLSHQTSMTTGPKYRIIDALLGRLNLESATAEDIGGQPEWWNGTRSELSDANLAPEAVLHHANLLGIQGPQLDAYKAWAIQHDEMQAAREVRDQPGYVPPITDAQDVEAKASDSLLGKRKVSAQEYQNLANDGRAHVESALANRSPNVLDTPELRSQAWHSVQEEWGGATVDAHSGSAIPADYAGDTFAVTARLKGMKEINLPIGATEAQFNARYTQALKMYKDVLDSEGGHLGIFRNETTGRIEFDPVYHTQNVYDTEAVGAYTHAVGGAYNFKTGDGLWIPHVADHEAFTSKAEAARAMKQSAARGRELARDPAVRPAYENALMEYHGSGALAKLRSFRDNLAHPNESLAVTLDSIMAQLFGFDKTHWGQKGEYAKYADLIRQTADQWSSVAGRQVMPHEVQALLWVYAKRFIGEQDWGRLQAHLGNVHTVLDHLEQEVASGKTLNVKNFDPLGPWWKEELQFSRDQLSVRTERKPLRTKRTAGTLTPEETRRLQELEQVPTRQATTIDVRGSDGTVESQIRNETSYDAKVLAHKEDQYVDYLTNTVAPMRKAIAAGDFNKARSIIDEYVTARRKAIMGSTEGGEFGPKMVQDPKGVAAQSIARLQYADHVPAPNPEALGSPELYSAFGDRVRGVTLEHPNKLGRIMMRLYSTADVTTLLHEDMHAFRLMAPGDEVAQLSHTYPHLQDATMTAARRADEERFVNDFMGYLRDRQSMADPRLSPAMQARVTARFNGPLHDLFNNVADLMDQHYGPALNSESGHAVPNEIVNYWDSIFNADIQHPTQVEDPLSAQYVPTPKGVNPTQLRGETDAAFAQRVRQYGEARGQSTVLAQRVRDAQQRAAAADKFANKMAGMVLEPTRSEVIAAKLEDRANRTLTKLSDQLEAATGNQVPRVWRPFMDAIDAIREEAKKDPSLAPLLEEIPDNFAAAMRLAAEQGFEPTHMPELTWDMAQKYMYGHLQLGGPAEQAGLRKENVGVLNRAGVVERNLESLGSGNVMAMKELLQSKLVQFTEENYARQWAPNTPLPEGWVPWEPTRDAIVTGRNLDNKTVAVSSNKIIPKEVYDTLRKFQRPPLQLPFRFLWKGPAITVWKNLLLTYSPTWYLKHFIGAVSLATAEGVRLRDWQTAWHQWKTNALPDAVRGRNIYSAIDDELGQAHSLIPRHNLKDVPSLVRSEGYKVAAHEINNKMRSSVKVVDGLSRAAVYAKTMRTTGDASRAAYRAFEAIGDFGRLSPIERSVVTQLIPFYAFQKSMLRILVKLPVDHPAATGLLMQIGQMQQMYLQQQLGGSVPDNYLGSDFINGKLMQVDKLNPLTDSWKLTTPAGIAASANPFIRLLAQDALGAPSYGAQAGMDASGNLIQQPSLGDQIMSTYTGAVPGLGKPFPPSLAITSALSTDQYDKLLKRIAKVGRAQQTVSDGGYLVTDAYKPKQATKSSGVNPWG